MQTFHVLIEGSPEPIVVEAENLAQAAQRGTEQGGQVIGLCAADSLTPDATGRLADAFLIPRARLIDHLAQKGADIAYQRIARDQARYQRIVVAVLAVVGLVGFGTVGAIITSPIQQNIKESLRTMQAEDRKAMEAELTETVQGLVNDKIGMVTTRLNAAEGLSSLRILSQQLDVKDSFSNQMRDDTMKAVSSVVQHGPTADLPDFRFALEGVLKSFAAANLSKYLDTIDDLAHEQIVESHIATNEMARHYGQRLAGDTEGAPGWDKDVINRFQQYTNAVREKMVPTVHLSLELLVLFMKEGRRAGSEGLAALIHEPIAWEKIKAQAIFHADLITYSNQLYWTKSGSTEARLIESRCRALIRSYHVDLDEVLQQSKGVKDELLKLMDRLAESRKEGAHRAGVAGEKELQKRYLEAHSQLSRYASHMKSGGYRKLVEKEGWE